MRKRAEKALEHRLIALTQPLSEVGELKLTDIIDIEILQKIQDAFAKCNNIASLIFDINGKPITKYSNFSEFCQIVRSTEKGLEKCKRSDAILGRKAASGKISIKLCENIKEIMCGAVPIIVQGQHIANWGIGQAVTKEINEDEVREFAHKIGVDEKELVEASKKLVRMSREEFRRILDLLNVIAEQVSLLGLQNLQQARNITERKKVEEKLKKSEQKLRSFFESATVGIWCFRLRKPVDITVSEEKILNEIFKARCVECNETYAKMMGATKNEILGMQLSEVMPNTEENREYLKAFIRNGFRMSGGISHEINKKGEEKYFSNSMVGTIKNGKVIEAWGTQTDITELKHLQQQKESSRKKEL